MAYPISLVDLKLEHFEQLIGHEFAIALEPSGEVQTKLKLISATSLGSASSPGRQGFSLIFDNEEGLFLSQGTFWLSTSSLGEHAIFLVPVEGRTGAPFYQAVFN